MYRHNRRWASLCPAVLGRVRKVFSVTDAFAIAGQSNAMGYATSNQTFSGGLVRNYSKKYALLSPAADPIDNQDGTATDTIMNNGSTPGGHWILPTATTLMPLVQRNLDVIPCGKDGSDITNDWAIPQDHQNRTTLYGAMVYRCLQYQTLTGRALKAVLWWQGETDVILQTAGATYTTALQSIGDTVFADLGCPVIACKLMHGVYAPDVQATINTAIGNAWGTHHILAGPDLSGINTDDNYHARANATVASVAALWATAIRTAVY